MLGTASGQFVSSHATDPQIVSAFSRGIEFDREGEFNQAFAAFAAGNAAMATSARPTDVVHDEAQLIERVIHDFDFSLFDHWQGAGDPTFAPIFVIGKPRSGSTLIEQILASHADVCGMGETRLLLDAAASMPHQAPYSGAPRNHFNVLAAGYLGSMHESGATAPWFIDKFLQNWRRVGVISLTFPDATILHSMRDPMDTCWSWFQHVFAEGNEISYDLAAIGHSYVRYRQLMDHWAKVLPGRVIDVRHEDLVADPDRQIRWLVTEACGLPWDEQCLRFYENDRPVFTASRDQVRQPIFTTSIGRWRNYERHLGPLIEALGPYGPGTS